MKFIFLAVCMIIHCNAFVGIGALMQKKISDQGLASSFGQRYNGYCVTRDGKDQNSKVERIGGTMSADECLRKCKGVFAISGCEYFKPERYCYTHSKLVARGNGDENYYCWISAGMGETKYKYYKCNAECRKTGMSSYVNCPDACMGNIAPLYMLYDKHDSSWNAMMGEMNYCLYKKCYDANVGGKGPCYSACMAAVMGKNFDVWYGKGTIKQQYSHCTYKCQADKFSNAIPCKDNCGANLVGQFLWKDKKARNLYEMFQERNDCQTECNKHQYQMTFSTCKGNCPGAVMGKYFDYWYGKCHGLDCKNMGIGDGDCDKDSDCRGDLVCGSDNCQSEFGHSGGFWQSDDDCCSEKSSTKRIGHVVQKSATYSVFKTKKMCTDSWRISVSCGSCGPNWGDRPKCEQLCTQNDRCDYYTYFSDRGCQIFAACPSSSMESVEIATTYQKNVATGTGCAHGWVGYKGHCYLRNTNSLDYDAAQRSCESVSAYLAVPNTAAENTFLTKDMNPSGSSYTWIGFDYTNNQKWEDGSSYGSTSSWRNLYNQDDASDRGNGEPAVFMRSNGDWSFDGKHYGYPSVCEKNADQAESAVSRLMDLLEDELNNDGRL